MSPGDEESRPSHKAATPNSTRSQPKDNRRRLVRINIGKVSTVFRSPVAGELDMAVRQAGIPARARHQLVGGRWSIGASSSEKLIKWLRGTGWEVVDDTPAQPEPTEVVLERLRRAWRDATDDHERQAIQELAGRVKLLQDGGIS